MTPHIQRWITGFIGVPVVFSIIYFGTDILFAFLILSAGVIACSEYNRMAFEQGLSWEQCAVFFGAVFLPTAAYLGGPTLLLASFTATVMASFLIFLGNIRKDPEISLIPVSKVLFAFAYLPLTLSHFILIRRWDQGVLWIFFVFILTVSGDTAAFYFGRTFGKHKLYPVVSPGKTVEGALGSFTGSIFACIIYKMLVLPSLPLIHALIIAIAGSCFSQLGDLFESAIKRSAGVKDSGHILPGHGGILDRLDSLIFLVPFVYYYRSYLIP